ncbi:rhodanese-like domain-containing protein [Jeongeupia sp. USM3]|uniref:rhodanese-like domain-containing protein n=1 Tax=Jeongeupia sp. USM3 TaxID=1906741 RepID=UPI00089DF279|nr:rhodanese-like domain-containing protein [Jeongeupia sp. USM3]AOX99678.1 hypothetical protein BJP62_03930 [Jeongeupia sp. USM3]
MISEPFSLSGLQLRPCLAVIAKCLVAAAALGCVEQVSAVTSVEEALKDISPASGMCLRDAVGASSGTVSAIRPKPDLSCAIAPTELSPMLGRPELTLIDVRLRADYDAARIDGAMNLSVTDVRTKSFLRDKLLVLIGSGKSERELYVACAELKGQGFKQVKVLRGGMPAWWSLQRPPGGEPGAGQQVTPLTATELWAESQFDANLILLATSDAAMQRVLPAATRLPNDQSATVRAALDKKRKAKQSPLGVVLVLPPNASGTLIAQIREGIQPLPLLVYTGSAAQYSQQIAQQKAIWAAQERGPKKLGCGL